MCASVVAHTYHTEALLLKKSFAFVLLRFYSHAFVGTNQGGIDEQTDGHHHQQGHDALGFFEIERRGQKLRGLEEAKAAFGIYLAFVAGQHLRRWQLGLVQFVRGEYETTVLVNKRLTGRDPRR